MNGIKNEFRIGEKVYHVSGNSESGIVIDVAYSFLNERYTYLVAVGWGGEFVCQEHELSNQPTF